MAKRPPKNRSHRAQKSKPAAPPPPPRDDDDDIEVDPVADDITDASHLADATTGDEQGEIDVDLDVDVDVVTRDAPDWDESNKLLNDIVFVAHTTLARREDDLEGLYEKMDALRATSSRMATQTLSRLEERQAKLEDELGQLTEMSHDVRRLLERFHGHRAEIAAVRSENETLEKASVERTRIDDIVVERGRELLDLQIAHQGLKKTIEDKDAEIASVKERATEADKLVRKLDAELISARVMLDTEKDARSSTTRALETTESARAESERRARELESELHRAEEEKAERDGKISDLLASIIEKEEAVRSANRNAISLSDDLDRTKRSLDDKDKRIAELSASAGVDELAAAKHEAERILASVVAEKDALIAELKELVVALGGDVEDEAPVLTPNPAAPAKEKAVTSSNAVPPSPPRDVAKSTRTSPASDDMEEPRFVVDEATEPLKRAPIPADSSVDIVQTSSDETKFDHIFDDDTMPPPSASTTPALTLVTSSPPRATPKSPPPEDDDEDALAIDVDDEQRRGPGILIDDTTVISACASLLKYKSRDGSEKRIRDLLLGGDYAFVDVVKRVALDAIEVRMILEQFAEGEYVTLDN